MCTSAVSNRVGCLAFPQALEHVAEAADAATGQALARFSISKLSELVKGMVNLQRLVHRFQPQLDAGRSVIAIAESDKDLATGSMKREGSVAPMRLRICRHRCAAWGCTRVPRLQAYPCSQTGNGSLRPRHSCGSELARQLSKAVRIPAASISIPMNTSSCRRSPQPPSHQVSKCWRNC